MNMNFRTGKLTIQGNDYKVRPVTGTMPGDIAMPDIMKDIPSVDEL